MSRILLSTLACATLTTAACGGPDKGPSGPKPVDLATARAAVDARLDAHLGTVAAGDIDTFVSAFSADVMWFGGAATEAITGPAAVKADLEAVFGPVFEHGGRLVTDITELGIGVTDDGRGAWAAHEVTVTIEGVGEPTTIPYRVTSVLGEDGGTWTIVAEHWSVGVPNELAFGMAAEGLWPELAPVGDAVAPGAEPVVALFREHLSDAAAWVGSYSDRADAFALGSAPEEKVPTGAAIKEAFGAMVGAYQVRLASTGGIRAGVVPGGKLAWVATNLDFTVTVEGMELTQPYRALVVYADEGGTWRPVQSHFSNGLPGA